MHQYVSHLWIKQKTSYTTNFDWEEWGWDLTKWESKQRIRDLTVFEISKQFYTNNKNTDSELEKTFEQNARDLIHVYSDTKLRELIKWK